MYIVYHVCGLLDLVEGGPRITWVSAMVEHAAAACENHSASDHETSLIQDAVAGWELAKLTTATLRNCHFSAWCSSTLIYTESYLYQAQRGGGAHGIARRFEAVVARCRCLPVLVPGV